MNYLLMLLINDTMLAELKSDFYDIRHLLI